MKQKKQILSYSFMIDGFFANSFKRVSCTGSQSLLFIDICRKPLIWFLTSVRNFVEHLSNLHKKELKNKQVKQTW